MADNDREVSYRRILIIFGMIFLIFGGLLVRLTMIQGVGYSRYSRLAATQRQGSLLTNVLRGSFFDRHGRMIRGTDEAWYLLIEKVNSARFEQIDNELAPILAGDFSTEYYKNKDRAFWIFPKPLNNYQTDRIIALHNPELKIIANSLHQDKYQGIAWHLLGFATQEQGFSGLEYLYQPLLRSLGNTGAIFTINDGKQSYFPGLGVRTQKILNPSGVVLTLDEDIQLIVEQVIDLHQISGAIVVLDARSGQILAMSSRPHIFNAGKDSIPEHPFINRAISAYHPGSIFKLVTLSAGLDSGLLNQDQLFNDQGFYQIGSKKWLCTTSKNGHGIISLTDALAYSCNPVFIEIAMRLQPQLILDYADRFGLGQPCNIGLRDESWGELPSGIGISDGDRANMALGQQDVYATPLQIASLVQTIANDGVRCIPQLVLGTVQQEGAAITLVERKPPVRVLSTATAQIVKTMMEAVVSYGTGTAAQLPTGAVGKTGTAQVGDDRRAPSHAWFAGFAPLHVPKYVVVVFCEQGISGSETAAPIFREVMEKVTSIKD